MSPGSWVPVYDNKIYPAERTAILQASEPFRASQINKNAAATAATSAIGKNRDQKKLLANPAIT